MACSDNKRKWLNIISEIFQELWSSIYYTLKYAFRDRTILFEISISPIIYIIISFYLYKDMGPEKAAIYLLIGAAAMGIWESSLLEGAWTVNDERVYGTLEISMVSPANISLILMGKCLAYSFLGLIVLIEASLVIFFNYGNVLASINLFELVTGFLTMLISFSVFGYFLSFGFLVSRLFIYISNILGDGIKLFCGVLVPLFAMPLGIKIISFILPPTYSLEIIRTKMINGFTPALTIGNSVIILYVLILFYLIISRLIYGKIEKHVRNKGNLTFF